MLNKNHEFEFYLKHFFFFVNSIKKFKNLHFRYFKIENSIEINFDFEFFDLIRIY